MHFGTCQFDYLVKYAFWDYLAVLGRLESEFGLESDSRPFLRTRTRTHDLGTQTRTWTRDYLAS